jgi:hypothetical protein
VDNRWTPVATPGPAAVASFQHSLLIRDGAVLGLWNHRTRKQASGEFMTREANEPPLPRGFAKIAGLEHVELPRIPEGIELDEAVASSDGTIYGVGAIAESDEDVQLLIWPPGQVEAERVTLPDADGLDYANLTSDGDEVWLSGGLYLARGRGRTFTRVPVALVGESGAIDEGDIFDVLETPDGALWLAVNTPAHLLFYQPAQHRDWVRVPLPSAAAPLEPEVSERWWTFDSEYGWLEASVMESEDMVVRIRELAWASGRVWIDLEADPVMDVEGEMFFDSRSLLLTVGELGRAAVRVPSKEDSYFEARRAEGAKFCSSAHDTFVWVVLGTGDQALALDEAQLDALRELDREDHGPWLRHLFIGELDGRRALILQVRFEDGSHVRGYVKRVSKQLGVPAKIDCRPWRAVEAVQ